MIHEGQDALFKEQFAESTDSYDTILQAAWDEALKLYCDWYVVQYLGMIKKSCTHACRSYSVDMRDDLMQDTILALYHSMSSYHPEKGELLKRLIWITKLYPLTRLRALHRKELRHLANFGNSDDLAGVLNSIPSPEKEVANEENETLLNMLRGLERWEHQLITMKIQLNLTNTLIAKMTGKAESVIRYHLNRIMGLIKIAGK